MFCQSTAEGVLSPNVKVGLNGERTTGAECNGGFFERGTRFFNISTTCREI